ncbi:hippurate hydrolase [Acrasis kona]|uniref:HipO n=1 Tax=Acrasis kona TaxID=1008807 RepID=A0AAW2Z381_9EUKA
MPAYSQSLILVLLLSVALFACASDVLAGGEFLVSIPELNTFNNLQPTNCTGISNFVNAPTYISTTLIERLTNLRQNIHKNAELPGEEAETSERIKNFVTEFLPDDSVVNVGGHGMLFLFKLGRERPGRKVVLFRADMDGLPIQESDLSVSKLNNYKSVHPNIFHGCGHDGHSAVVAGMASVVQSIRQKYQNDTDALNGDIILLFQPAEETGAGATAMKNDPKFTAFDNGIINRVDAAFALHNLPGHDFGKVLLKRGTFAAASKGVRIELRGETSHAAQPEKGRSPAGALSKIISDLEDLAFKGRNRLLPQYRDFILLTVVHAHLGGSDVAYGTTPGEARVMVTVRTYLDEDMDTLVQEVRNIVSKACESLLIESEMSFSDEFYATRNEPENTSTDKSLIELVRTSAEENNLQSIEMHEPFRWSEDFGNFQFKGTTYFAIGSGVDHPSLHNDDYDYPDELTLPALSMFARLAEKLVVNKV